MAVAATAVATPAFSTSLRFMIVLPAAAIRPPVTVSIEREKLARFRVFSLCPRYFDPVKILETAGPVDDRHLAAWEQGILYTRNDPQAGSSMEIRFF